MLTEWQQIRAFPGYSVSDTGFVRNDDTGRVLTMLVNQSGVVNVGLTKNKVQYKRVVSLLVADAFLVPPRSKAFDSVINLDGDRFNNHVENLLWRPKWFSAKYFKQFKDEAAATSNLYPVVELNSGLEFKSTMEAAKTFGLLDRDVRISSIYESEVWPTRQRFRSL